MITISKRLPAGSIANEIRDLQNQLRRYKTTNYERGSFSVKSYGNIHELSIGINELNTNSFYLPATFNTFAPDTFPKSVKVICNKPIAVNTNTGSSVFVFNSTPISSTYVTFDSNNTISVNIASALGYTSFPEGHHYLYLNASIYAEDGSKLFIEPWEALCSTDVVSNRPGEQDYFNDQDGPLFIEKIILRSNDSTNSVVTTFLNRNKNIRIIDSVFINADNSSQTFGFIYILYTIDNSFRLLSISPSRDSVISNIDNKLTLKFSKEISKAYINNIHSYIYVSNSTGSVYYTCTGSQVLGRGDWVSAYIPTEGLTYGVHFVRVSGSSLYSIDGEPLNHIDPVLYSSYYKRKNVLNDLYDVNVTGAQYGDVLQFDGITWGPAVVSGGGGGGAPVGATYVTLSNHAGLTNERSLITGFAVNITDGGANSTVSIGVDTGVIGTIYAPINSSYVVISSDPTLTNDRVLTPGTGMLLVDSGSNSNVIINVNTGYLDTVYSRIGSGGSSTGGLNSDQILSRISLRI